MFGREVILRDKFGKSDYFLWYSSDLSADSTWFYKPVTNLDFSVGNTYYRSVYIGPHEKENLQEYVGTINSSASTCATGSSGSPYPTTDIDVTVAYENTYTSLESANSIVLDDEVDSTNKLQGLTFTSSVAINQTVKVGKWVKIWIKIHIPQNISLVNSNNCYVLNVGALSITISSDISRLSLAKVFNGKITNGDITLKEIIPENQPISNVYKVINDPYNQTHIFYNNDENKIQDLIVYKQNNVSDNKYINVDLSSVVGDITGFSHRLNDIAAIGNVFTCLVSGNIDQKYIVDIIRTNIDQKNYFYIFYNQIYKANTTETISTTAGDFIKYDLNYNHESYKWKSGVILMDYSTFGKEAFDTIESGYENKLDETNWVGQDFLIKNDHFLTSISLQDDLFTTIGYNTENSYQIATSGQHKNPLFTTIPLTTSL
jgi:hypothetical protein